MWCNPRQGSNSSGTVYLPIFENTGGAALLNGVVLLGSHCFDDSSELFEQFEKKVVKECTLFSQAVRYLSCQNLRGDEGLIFSKT